MGLKRGYKVGEFYEFASFDGVCQVRYNSLIGRIPCWPRALQFIDWPHPLLACSVTIHRLAT